MIYMLCQIIMEIWDSVITQLLPETQLMESGMNLMIVEYRNLDMIAKVIYNNKFALMLHTTCFIGRDNGMKKINLKELILKKLPLSQTCNYYKNEFSKSIQ